MLLLTYTPPEQRKLPFSKITVEDIRQMIERDRKWREENPELAKMVDFSTYLMDFPRPMFEVNLELERKAQKIVDLLKNKLAELENVEFLTMMPPVEKSPPRYSVLCSSKRDFLSTEPGRMTCFKTRRTPPEYPRFYIDMEAPLNFDLNKNE